MIFPRSIHLVVCIVVFLVFTGCSEKTGPTLTEQDIQQRVQRVHDRLGFSAEKMSQEVTNSINFTKEQAADLKMRVADLVVAYEKLFNDAGCADRENSEVCSYLWSTSVGLRYNVTILDAKHSGLPSLPAKNYEKR